MKFKFPFIFLLFASQAQAQVPSTWTDTDYTAGALVLDSSGNSFIAQKDITKGTALTDTTAWLSLDAAAPTSAPSTTPPTTTPDAAQVASLTTPETSSSTASTARLINISTRGYVGTGDDAMIAGFVIEGDATATLKCMVGVSSGGLVEKDDFLILKDAFIILYKNGVEIDRNNDWTELSAEDQQSIQDANQVPGSTKDSALVWDLGPGVYGVTVIGVGNTTGITNVGVNDLGQNGGTGSCRILNISTRGKVLTGDSVMIAGFVISGSNETDTLRVKLSNNGPTLGDDPSSGFVCLKDPYLQLVGGASDSNNDWADRQDSEKSYLTQNNQTPSDSRESFMLKTLAPNAYGIVMSGVGGTTGNAIVGVTIAD
tara:strand:+ start:311 stop:1423 length:1113 start_codon:yes stop_codon:yes gene_type:complete